MPAELAAIEAHRWTREVRSSRQQNGGEIWTAPFSVEEVAAAERLLARYRSAT